MAPPGAPDKPDAYAHSPPTTPPGATPNRTTKPTDAGTERYWPEMKSAKTPIATMLFAMGAYIGGRNRSLALRTWLRVVKSP